MPDVAIEFLFEMNLQVPVSEMVEASEYYHRVSPFFETASETYGWLNGIVSIGIGHKRPWGGLYSIHQVL